MLRAVIASDSAKVVYSTIPQTVIVAWLLGVPNYHDLRRTHPSAPASSERLRNHQLSLPLGAAPRTFRQIT
jgi:hypothetical protein